MEESEFKTNKMELHFNCMEEADGDCVYHRPLSDKDNTCLHKNGDCCTSLVARANRMTLELKYMGVLHDA